MSRTDRSEAMISLDIGVKQFSGCFYRLNVLPETQTLSRQYRIGFQCKNYLCRHIAIFYHLARLFDGFLIH